MTRSIDVAQKPLKGKQPSVNQENFSVRNGIYKLIKDLSPADQQMEVCSKGLKVFNDLTMDLILKFTAELVKFRKVGKERTCLASASSGDSTARLSTRVTCLARFETHQNKPTWNAAPL